MRDRKPTLLFYHCRSRSAAQYYTIWVYTMHCAQKMTTEIIYTYRPNSTGQGQTVPDSTRQGWALGWAGPGRAAQDRSGQGREVSSSAGQRQTGPGGVMKDRSVPDGTGQDLAWSAGKGSVGQCRARQDRAGPASVRTGRGRLRQDRVEPGRAG